MQRSNTIPKFIVKSPDGRTFTVNGPEGSTAAQAQARVQARLKVTADRTTLQSIRGAAGSFVDGIFPGTSAAIRGSRGVADNAVNALLGKDSFHPSQSYTQYARAYKKDQAAYEEDHPKVANAAGWAGVGASFALPGVKVMNSTAKASTLAARGSVPASVIARAARKRRAVAGAVNSAATGGVMGTAAGALQGEGTDRIGNAVAGGIGGMVIGAAAHPVVAGTVRAAKGAVRFVAPHLSAAASQRFATSGAQRRIHTALGNDGHTPEEAAALLEAPSAQASRSMIADISPTTRAATVKALKPMGPGQSAVREAIAERQRNMSGRVQAHVATSLGETVDPYVQSAALNTQALEAAKPLYDEAYQVLPTVTPAIREFMDSRQGRSAIAAGVDDIANTPTARRNAGSETPMKEGVIWDPELGSYRSGEVPVMEAMDGAKRHLDNIIYDGENRFLPRTGPGGTNTRPAELQRQELLAELDAQNPAYARAREAYAGPAADRDAFLVGRQEQPGSTRNTLADATAQTGRMNPSQLDQMRLGDRTRLSDAVADVPLHADATAPLGTNTTRADLIRHIHGPEAADRLTALTAAEREGHLTYRATARTPGTLTADDNPDAASTVLSAGAHLATGSPVRAALQLAGRTLTGGAQRTAESGETARMLTSEGPAAQDALRLIADRAERDATAKARLQSLSGRWGRVGSTQFVGNSGDRTDMYPDE